MPALFGLLTAKFEDAAGYAAEGQRQTANQLQLERHIASVIAEAEILVRTIWFITDDGRTSQLANLR